MSEFFTASELVERIENNDRRCTAKPYLLLLREKIPIVVDGDYQYSKVEWVENVTGDYATGDTKNELIHYLRENYFEDESWNPEYSDITKIHTDYKEVTCNVFLTDKGYQDHLKVNGHNLKKHDTFGIHAFRNKEIKSLFNVLYESKNLEERLKEAENKWWDAVNSDDSEKIYEEYQQKYMSEDSDELQRKN